MCMNFKKDRKGEWKGKKTKTNVENCILDKKQNGGLSVQWGVI